MQPEIVTVSVFLLAIAVLQSALNAFSDYVVPMVWSWRIDQLDPQAAREARGNTRSVVRSKWWIFGNLWVYSFPHREHLPWVPEAIIEDSAKQDGRLLSTTLQVTVAAVAFALGLNQLGLPLRGAVILELVLLFLALVLAPLFYLGWMRYQLGVCDRAFREWLAAQGADPNRELPMNDWQEDMLRWYWRVAWRRPDRRM